MTVHVHACKRIRCSITKIFITLHCAYVAHVRSKNLGNKQEYIPLEVDVAPR